MKINKKFNDFVYFIFPFINGFKKNKKKEHFGHFKLLISLLVNCLIINILSKFTK